MTLRFSLRRRASCRRACGFALVLTDRVICRRAGGVALVPTVRVMGQLLIHHVCCSVQAFGVLVATRGRCVRPPSCKLGPLLVRSVCLVAWTILSQFGRFEKGTADERVLGAAGRGSGVKPAPCLVGGLRRLGQSRVLMPDLATASQGSWGRNQGASGFLGESCFCDE